MPNSIEKSCVFQREHTAVLYCSKIPESWCLFAGHRHFAPVHPLLSKVKASPVHYMPTMTSLHSTLLSSLYSPSPHLSSYLNTCFYVKLSNHPTLTSLPCTQNISNHHQYFYTSDCSSTSVAQRCSLAGMNITGADLFAVLAAGHHRPFTSFFHIHETFLDAPTTWFGTVCPATPGLHPATFQNKKDKCF